MEKSHLKIARIIIPGVMAVICFVPLTLDRLSVTGFTDRLTVFQGIVYLVVVMPLGGLYYISRIRLHFLRPSLSRIQSNIKDRLLNLAGQDVLVKKHAVALRNGDAVMHVFYGVVDHDSSLSEKAKSIYLNGLIWSTTADAAFFSMLFVPVYAAAFAFYRQTAHFCWLAFGSAVLYFFARYVLLPRVAAIHISLSNEQLDSIELHHGKDVVKRLQEAARQCEARAQAEDTLPSLG